MNKSSHNKLSFVLYDSQSSPRFFEIKKSVLRLIMFGLPVITFISLLLSALGIIYFQQIRQFAKQREPKIISELRDEKKNLQLQVSNLESLRDQLQNKIATGATAAVDSFEELNLYKTTPGRQDLTKSPEIDIEAIDSVLKDGQLLVDFRIINLTQTEKRISGFIFVILKDEDRIQTWPKGAFSDQEMQMVFNKGELFSASRFRPVQALFPAPNSEDVLIKILIFSRTGDLIYKKIASSQVRKQ